VKLKASYAADYTYQWQQGGVDIGGATGYLYYPTVAGSYSCVITNAAGCSRETSSINVTACREGEEVIVAADMDVYPNPASTQFTVSLNTNTEFSGNADVYVVNLIGEIVYTGMAQSINGVVLNTIELDHAIAGGLYLVKVIANGNEYTEQLVIAK
jgi:hypothetical protein